MCWGITGTLAISGSGSASVSATVSLPSSFFSSVQYAAVTASGSGTAVSTQYATVTNNVAPNTTTLNFFFSQWAGVNGQGSASWLVIGT